MLNFALTGVAGFIAPRHITAIKNLGHNLASCYDPHDSVGKLDSLFPSCLFYKDFESFANSVSSKKIDYLSICSPNHFHYPQIIWGLNSGLDVICEKPLVLYSSQLNEIKKQEERTGKRVYSILQLREHASVKNLRDKIHAKKSDIRPLIDLSYFTSRGHWYHQTWKANEQLSGGLTTNIGVHFFDMLSWVFGKATSVQLHYSSPTTCAGFLELEHADVRWILSIDEANLPVKAKEKGLKTYRSLLLDNEEFEFSKGFEDLHDKVYEEIIAGNGYGSEDSTNAIEIVEKIRSMTPASSLDKQHPYLATLNL